MPVVPPSSSALSSSTIHGSAQAEDYGLTGGDLATASELRPHSNENPLLDVLRSVAVCLVMLDHTLFALGRHHLWRFDAGELGVTGVWLFFVHTSLVLMWSLERRPYALDFFIRRIFRVYPLAIAATLAVYWLHAPLSKGIIPYFGTRTVLRGNLLANLLLVFDLVPRVDRYFAILHVEWTLPWEMHMYVVLPALFAFARRERTLWTLLLIWALAVSVLFSQGTSVISFPGSSPHFLAGVIAYVAFMKFRPFVPSFCFPLFLGALLFIPLQETLRGSYALTLALGLGLPCFKQFGSQAARYLFQRIARYSYGLYLMHPFALWISFRLLHLKEPWDAGVAMLVIAWTLSVAAYHLLERPMIDIGSRVARRMERFAVARGADQAIGV